MKKVISVILAVMLIITVVPLSASAEKYNYAFGGLLVKCDEKLMEKYIVFGAVRVDYDVDFRNNTLYVNTSKRLHIEAEERSVSQNVRIVFEHNANVIFNNLK